MYYSAGYLSTRCSIVLKEKSTITPVYNGIAGWEINPEFSSISSRSDSYTTIQPLFKEKTVQYIQSPLKKIVTIRSGYRPVCRKRRVKLRITSTLHPIAKWSFFPVNTAASIDGISEEKHDPEIPSVRSQKGVPERNNSTRVKSESIHRLGAVVGDVIPLPTSNNHDDPISRCSSSSSSSVLLPHQNCPPLRITFCPRCHMGPYASHSPGLAGRSVCGDSRGHDARKNTWDRSVWGSHPFLLPLWIRSLDRTETGRCFSSL